MGLSYAQEYSCRDHFRQRAFERFGVDDQHLNKWINQHLSSLSPYDSNVVQPANTEAYVARFTKDCKCYSVAGKTQAKLFPIIKKNAVVDVMKYTETVKGKRWYFIRIPYPNDEGFVREFVPAGYFKKLI